jgi:hypothetical protein
MAHGAWGAKQPHKKPPLKIVGDLAMLIVLSSHREDSAVDVFVPLFGGAFNGQIVFFGKKDLRSM